jgi:uncharacterized membrane protein SpoIIM required for sporulation
MYELLLREIKNKPLFFFVFAFGMTFFASYLASSTDSCSAGILALTISMIPLIQVMTKMVEIEEIKEERLEKNLFVRHEAFIKNYLALFFGAVFGFYLAYILLGPKVFLEQIKAISDIRSAIASGMAVNSDQLFAYILLNNLKVLILSYLFSFLFGAGALYVILWNASIVGVFLGEKAKEVQGSFFYKYFAYPMYKLALLLPHGILEFVSYFLAALSGGILSVALIKQTRRRLLEKILIDSILLFVSSLVLLVVAAIVEAYTPF